MEVCQKYLSIGGISIVYFTNRQCWHKSKQNTIRASVIYITRCMKEHVGRGFLSGLIIDVRSAKIGRNVLNII